LFNSHSPLPYFIYDEPCNRDRFVARRDVFGQSYYLFLNHVSIRTNPLFSSVTTNSNCTIRNEPPVVVDDSPVSFSQIAREVVEQQRTVDYYMHAYNREHEYHPK
ncbi:hypothetical protein WA538_000766, partial [Blastocystis sp. DL]